MRITVNRSAFIRLGISLPFSDHATDDPTVLILRYVLASKFIQFHLQVCRRINDYLTHP